MTLHRLCLVRECRELKEVFGTHFTEDIISNSTPSLKEVMDAILECDRRELTAKCSVIAEVAARTNWSKLWDGAGRWTLGTMLREDSSS